MTRATVTLRWRIDFRLQGEEKQISFPFQGLQEISCEIVLGEDCSVGSSLYLLVGG